MERNNAFSHVVASLRAGKPAVFPTDTVYGLGVSVLHARTPEAIYDIKQRDAGKPIAWLVDSPDALARFGMDVPERAFELAKRHWPGALTIIVKASDEVPEAFRAVSGTIGLRMPASDTALALMHELGSPLATSSANLSGGIAPQSIDEVDEALLERVDAVLSDNAPRSGRASTVIDCSKGSLDVIRPGDISV